MNYQETLAYLDSLGKFGIRLGMERIEGLLRELGNPERKIKKQGAKVNIRDYFFQFSGIIFLYYLLDYCIWNQYLLNDEYYRKNTV